MKNTDLNADYNIVCVKCRKNAELSSDCAECTLYDTHGVWICEDCDLNPGACAECGYTVPNIRAQAIILQTSEKPVVLVYNDVDYDYPIHYTIKKETDTLISVDGWWSLGDTLYLPIDDTTMDERTFRV